MLTDSRYYGKLFACVDKLHPPRKPRELLQVMKLRPRKVSHVPGKCQRWDINPGQSCQPWKKVNNQHLKWCLPYASTVPKLCISPWKITQGHPWWSSGSDSIPPLQGVQFPALVQELSPGMLHSMAKVNLKILSSPLEKRNHPNLRSKYYHEPHFTEEIEAEKGKWPSTLISKSCWLWGEKWQVIPHGLNDVM